MRRSRHWLVLVIAGVLALAGGVWWSQRSDAPKDASVLFALSLPDTEGKDQALDQWRGKVVVVNFWATWCEPCRKEMPDFVKLQSEKGGQGLQFVGIAVDDAAKAGRFSKEIGLNYPSLVGGYGAMELSKTFGNTLSALPFTLIVDRKGQVVMTQLGPLKQDRLNDLLTKLL